MYKEKQTEIKTDVQKELNARDTLSNGLAKLRTRKQQLETEIQSNAEKRSKMVLERVEHVKAGGSDEGLNALITKSQEQETIDRAELEAIEKTIPVDEGKLKMEQAALKRAALEAIKSRRPDAEINAMFVQAMDAVDIWEKTTEDILRDLDVRSQMTTYDGDWRLQLEPHLKNEIIKRLNVFVPTIEQPEPTPTNDIPAVRPVEPEPIISPTHAEVMADCRKNARENVIRGTERQDRAISESSFS